MTLRHTSSTSGTWAWGPSSPTSAAGRCPSSTRRRRPGGAPGSAAAGRRVRRQSSRHRRGARGGRRRVGRQLPDQRPGPDRAGQGAVHAVLRRGRRRGRRPDRLPALGRRRAAGAERGELRGGGPPAGRGRPGRDQRPDRHDDWSRCWPSRARGRRGDRGGRAARGADYMAFVTGRWQGGGVTVCRTGYTGERGVELLCDGAVAEPLWDALLAAAAEQGGRACGLGARDTLRTEMGYPLHGHERQPADHPGAGRCRLGGRLAQAGVLGPGGAARREERGPARVAWALLATDRGVPRPEQDVLADDGRVVGSTTSGTFSPTLRQGIALALLDPAVASRGRGGGRRAGPPARLPGGAAAVRPGHVRGLTGSRYGGRSRGQPSARPSRAAARDSSTAAPSTSPVIPPNRRTQRRSSSRVASHDAAGGERAGAPPVRAAAVAASRPRRGQDQTPTGPAATGDGAGARSPEPVRPGRRDPGPAGQGQPEPGAHHRDQGSRAPPRRGAAQRWPANAAWTSRTTARVGDQAGRAGVAAAHHLQRPVPVVGGGQPVRGVGQPVQVQPAAGQRRAGNGPAPRRPGRPEPRPTRRRGPAATAPRGRATSGASTAPGPRSGGRPSRGVAPVARSACRGRAAAGRGADPSHRPRSLGRFLDRSGERRLDAGGSSGGGSRRPARRPGRSGQVAGPAVRPRSGAGPARAGSRCRPPPGSRSRSTAPAAGRA